MAEECFHGSTSKTESPVKAPLSMSILKKYLVYTDTSISIDGSLKGPDVWNMQRTSEWTLHVHLKGKKENNRNLPAWTSFQSQSTDHCYWSVVVVPLLVQWFCHSSYRMSFALKKRCPNIWYKHLPKVDVKKEKKVALRFFANLISHHLTRIWTPASVRQRFQLHSSKLNWTNVMMCTQEFLRAGLLFPSKTLFCVLPASHRIFDLFLHSTDSICMSGHDYVSSKFPFDPNHSDALFVDVWIPH